MQINGDPRTSCIRSYQQPAGSPDTTINYDWSLLEAATATCAPHPYSPPIPIKDQIEHVTLLCQDPSRFGYGNPIFTAAAEAGSILTELKNQGNMIYVSLGAGDIKTRSFETLSRQV